MACWLTLPGFQDPRPEVEAVREVGADHVVVITVDGLRSDAILFAGPENLPALHRLMSGPSTLNARTDPELTVTLPNHLALVTGRLAGGEGGHAWRGNETPKDGETLAQTAGEPVPSMFQQAHRHGIHTAVLAGKSKLRLLPQSWPELAEYQESKIPAELTTRLLEIWQQHASSLSLIHFRAADDAGHDHGWTLAKDSPYLQAVAAVDQELQRILQTLDDDSKLGSRVVLILTADHGGGGPWKHHRRSDLWVNYVIPFLVWQPGLAEADLYALNAHSRLNPGLSAPRPGESPLPPIRNADAANLALDLLGLPPLSGSTVNFEQDLQLLPQAVPSPPKDKLKACSDPVQSEGQSF